MRRIEHGVAGQSQESQPKPREIADQVAHESERVHLSAN